MFFLFISTQTTWEEWSLPTLPQFLRSDDLQSIPPKSCYLLHLWYVIGTKAIVNMNWNKRLNNKVALELHFVCEKEFFLPFSQSLSKNLDYLPKMFIPVCFSDKTEKQSYIHCWIIHSGILSCLTLLLWCLGIYGGTKRSQILVEQRISSNNSRYDFDVILKTAVMF